MNEVLNDPVRRANFERRFWSKVNRRGHGECWPWVAKARSSTGYGAIGLLGSPRPAHRVAWALQNAAHENKGEAWHYMMLANLERDLAKALRFGLGQ